MFTHDIDPIIATVGGVHLWWYGTGFALGFWQMHRYIRTHRRSLGLSPRQVYTLSLWLVVGVLAGGRLVEVLFDEWAFYSAHPSFVPRYWLGGMATHGLLIGAASATALFAWWERRPFRDLADALVIPGALLMGLGRLGNFVDGLIVGSVTPHPHPPPYIIAKKSPPRNRSRDNHSLKRTTCTTGEVDDGEVGMCGPTFHAPLAFDGSIMDHETPACNSFYRSMCGKWNDEHLNDNRAFSYGYHKNQKHIEKLINFETLYHNGVLTPGPSSSSLTDFYRSCLRAASPHHQKKESILEHKHMLKRILGDLTHMGDVPAMFGRLARAGFTLPFQLSIERHPTEPRMIPLITYDGFPRDLTESQIISLYQRTTEIHGLNILEMDHHIQSVLGIMRSTRIHNTRPIESITNYVQYVEETFPRDVMRFDSLSQSWNVRGHQRMRGWDVFFQELDGTGLRFDGHQEVWVIDKPYFDWLFGEGLAHFTFKEWYAYAEFSILFHSYDFVPLLADDVYFKQHDERGPVGPGGRFYNRIPRDIHANHTMSDVENKCIRITQHLLPGLVARRFLRQYFPEKERIKKEVLHMVQGIIESFVNLVRTTPWMSEADRTILIDKMHSTLIRVAEPNHWHAEPFAERISEDLYWHNLNMIRAYRVQRNLELWSRDNLTHFDRSAIAFFSIPLTSVNAYYSGPTNTITVLAGILQAPFYNVRYNDISKHAILGSILGHELSHMADNSGLFWGARGSLHTKGILSPQGMTTFFERTACVVREYGPAPMGCEESNTHYGNSTLGEDLADLTGMELAWQTYFRQNPNAPLADKQHFFMVLAQAFCEKYDQQHLCEAVKNDVHAIAMFRINRTFRNMNEFQAAFGCHDGQGMYKKAEDMCRVYGA